MTKDTLSRRSFLAGAALTGATLAGGSLLGCSAGKPNGGEAGTGEVEPPASWNYEADCVIMAPARAASCPRALWRKAG